MQVQGSQILNTAYITGLSAQMTAANSCAELQALVDESMGSILAMKAGIQAQIDAFAPMLALLSFNPTNLGQVISFIQNLVLHFLTPQLEPAILMAEKLTAIAAQISALESQIAALQANFPSCTITIPT